MKKLISCFVALIMSLFLFGHYFGQILADWSNWETPIVQYDFEGEKAATRIKDRVGSNDLLLSATSGTATGIQLVGKAGRRAIFNGTTDYGSANDSALFSQTGSFSVEAWVKFDTGSTTPGTIQTVLAKWDETTDIRSYRLTVETDSTGRNFPKFQVSTDGTSANIKTATGRTQILPNQWYLFQGYYNATNPGNIYIYINGVREGSATSVGTAISDTTSNFYLGTTKTGASSYANFLDGSIDELRLFSGTRDEGSLAYSMERGKPVVKLDFNDGSGFQTMNKAPVFSRVALTNFATNNSQWVSGNNNYALQFDGTDDFVDLGNHDRFQLGGAISISTWINVGSLGNYAIVSQPNTGGYTFQLTSSGNLTFGSMTGTTVASTGAGITTSKWTNVAVSYDGANASFYVNGRLVSSPALALWSVVNGAVLVGKAGATPNYFAGKMDDLMIYPYNRTMFEVYVDMAGGAVNFGKAQSLEANNSQTVCPSGFVSVPGDPLYGTATFCVMKYEAKCASTADLTTGIAPAHGDACSGESGGDYYGTYKNNTAGCNCSSANSKNIVSVASGFPIAYIAQDDNTANDAKSYCEANGWHLITNNEWMTIARNNERLGSNWCSSNGTACGYSPGQSGKVLASSHNDGNNEAAAGGDASSAIIASTDDSQACYGTTTNGSNTCGGTGSQKRTLALSNGEVVWDMAGNLYEWTDNTVLRKDQPESSTAGVGDTGWFWSDFATGSVGSTLDNNGQGPSMGYDAIRPSVPSWNANQGVGRIYHYSLVGDVNTTVYAFLRGAVWYDSSHAGVFTLRLSGTPGPSGYSNVGFRCAVSP